MIYVVLGMHKSGTTLGAQILHRSGISMVEGSEDQSYDKGNKYEHVAARSINHQLLGSEGLYSLNFTLPDKMEVTPEIESQIKALIEESSRNHENWGFKDPRTCYTYAIWKKYLPKHKIVVIYRSPEEVWQRYSKSSKRHYFSLLLNFFDRWCEHNDMIIQFLKNTDQEYIVINYKELMTNDSEFARFEKFVGHKLQDDRDPKMYRSHSKKISLFNLVKTLKRFPTGKSPDELMQNLQSLTLENNA